METFTVWWLKTIWESFQRFLIKFSFKRIKIRELKKKNWKLIKNFKEAAKKPLQ